MCNEVLVMKDDAPGCSPLTNVDKQNLKNNGRTAVIRIVLFLFLVRETNLNTKPMSNNTNTHLVYKSFLRAYGSRSHLPKHRLLTISLSPWTNTCSPEIYQPFHVAALSLGPTGIVWRAFPSQYTRANPAFPRAFPIGARAFMSAWLGIIIATSGIAKSH